MEIAFILPFIGIFLFFNFKIVYSDITEKKIPNRYLLYLLYLLPIWYIYIFVFAHFGEIYTSTFILQIFLTFLVSFSFFHFGFWGAGDAKYLLVLSLFIPHIGIIPFIGHIAYITLIFLFLYFIWFWIGPNLWNKQKRTNIYSKLWEVKKEKIITENKNKSYKQITIEVLKFLNIFFLIFISLRLIRTHIIDYIYVEYGLTVVDIVTHPYGIYILLGGFGIIVLISYIVKFIFSLYQKLTEHINPIISLLIINIAGVSFFIYEYFRDSQSFIKTIILVFSLYLFLFLLVKVLLFAYRLVFIMQEQSIIHIDDLKEGMMIDKSFLKKAFRGQKKIFHFSDITALDMSVDKETIELIKEKYKQKNIYSGTKDIPGVHDDLEVIQIQKTFAFGTFIYLGFIVSTLFYLYDFHIIKYLLSLW